MILVFVDFMNSEEEIPIYEAYLKKLGIAAKVTDSPDSWRHPSAYTHIFLDYGGMDMPGNSLFDHINREVYDVIENHPSRQFIIISVMGKDWFERDFEMTAHNLTFMSNFRDKEELQKILSISGPK